MIKTFIFVEDGKKRCYVDAYKKWENFCVNGAGERI